MTFVYLDTMFLGVLDPASCKKSVLFFSGWSKQYSTFVM